MLRDSTVAVVVVVVVVRTRPRAIPLAMIHMRKSIHGLPFVPLYGYGAPLGGLRPPELRYNAEMSSVRVTVEWLFGDVINDFKFLDFKKNLKIGMSSVGKNVPSLCYS